MSNVATLSPRSPARSWAECARVVKRAKQGARWVLTRIPSRVLAPHFGVRSESRARHIRAEETEFVTQTLALIRDPHADGPAVVAVCLEALEDRYMAEAEADAEKLHARLAHLMEEAEHKAQAGQDRALMTGRGVNDSCLHHASLLLEIVAIRRALGLEDA